MESSSLSPSESIEQSNKSVRLSIILIHYACVPLPGKQNIKGYCVEETHKSQCRTRQSTCPKVSIHHEMTESDSRATTISPRTSSLQSCRD